MTCKVRLYRTINVQETKVFIVPVLRGPAMEFIEDYFLFSWN